MSKAVQVYQNIFCFKYRNCFIRVFWFSLLNSDNNITVPLLFSCIKMEYPHCGLYYFLSTPSWQILSTYFLKMVACALATRYGFSWYALASGFSYIPTGFILQVSSVPSKINPCSLNTLWSIYWYSYVKYLIYGVTLRRSDFCGEFLSRNLYAPWQP